LAPSYQFDEKTNKTNGTAASWVALNVGQDFLIRACLLLCLFLAAYRVTQGEMSVGDFVAVQIYILNLYRPLSFLGTIYGIVVQAFVDMQNLSQLVSAFFFDVPFSSMLKALLATCTLELRSRAQSSQSINA
jgi:ABC-type transport system involved in Fe-S cluster assembly fused permease/ATPase subunit